MITCPLMLTAALFYIDRELTNTMENITQDNYDSPFGNTGNHFSNDVFEVEAFSWREEYNQPFNFKWRDVEVSWYKYLGRSMEVNREVSNDEIMELLEDCIRSLGKLENEYAFI